MAATTSGIIAGANPLEYSSSSPYTLFFFQMILILCFAEFLHWPLRKLKQPRVIAEVLAGILLGPTAFGKIPNFTSIVFPAASKSGLSLVSNIGICLLLFMVGCEVDTKFMKKHLITALTVGIVNMAVPFGLGCAFSVALWNHYKDGIQDTVHFTTFMVFIGVSLCVTAFPVLVRILTELRLLKDRVGTVVLAAGITNDLIGWILLALSITLANATNPAVTGYIVLVTIGWALFICYVGRWVLRFVLDRQLHDLSNPNGPSTTAMFVILIVMFTSAFFTDIIGVHPIFGAFMVGVVVPRDNNYVIRLTARIEDLVNILLAPIYFGIAGLNADLSLLDEGIDWAYIVGLIGLAMVGKLLGGTIPARISGLFWRESITVGILMSCKGIVEIVVLQTGLKAGIISDKLFAMFILMALLTTFLTTPLTIWAYPQAYRDKAARIRRDQQQAKIEEGKRKKKEEVAAGGAAIDTVASGVNRFSPVASISSSSGHSSTKSLTKRYKHLLFDKLILPVDSLESVSNNLILVDRFCSASSMPMHAVNMKQLTDRTADILHASMMRSADDQFDQFDGQYLNAMLSILKVFCELNGVPFSSELVFSLPDSMLQSLMLNDTFQPEDLLILTVGSKYYSDHPNYLSQFTSVAREADYYHALFINNNQDVGNLREYEKERAVQNRSRALGRSRTVSSTTKDWDNSSLLSNETILNPRSFEISTVTLISNPGEATKDELVALRLFSILVSRRDVTEGSIVSCKNQTPDLYSVVSPEFADNGKVKSVVCNSTETKSYEDYVLSIGRSSDESKIDELFIITNACPFKDELMKILIANNQKIMVVV